MFRSLNSIINSISSNHRLKKYFIHDKVKKIWKEKIDLQIQANTKIVNLNYNVLTIKTTTPTWKTELAFQKTELLIIINNNLESNHKIKDIKFI